MTRNITCFKRLLFLMALILPGLAFSQAKTISGTVSDSESQTTLPGVSVYIAGTQTGTVTTVTGEYSISASPTDTLVFSFIGYQTSRIHVGNRTTINVPLTEDATALEEVLVVGYGAKKKSMVTAAISSIKPEEIENMGYSQTQEAIQGRTAGVNITQQSGAPGGAVKVRIRGTGSNGNSEPLYIVDGMRTDDISFLDPNEISNMEILKDGASAAIYGAEGANGVVIITTKGGLADGIKSEPEISYDFQYGIQMPNNNLEVMNSQQHAQYLEEAGVTSRGSSVDYANLPTTNWLDEIYDNAPQSRHALSFRGSTGTTSYYVQGAYFSQDGVIGGDNSKYDRYSGRVNLNTEVKEWFDVGLNMSYIHSRRTGITENSEFGGVVTNAILMDPATPVVYEGNLPSFPQSQLDAGQTLLQDASGRYYGISEYVNGEIFNPVAGSTLNRGDGNNDNRIFGTVYGNLKLGDHVTVTSRFGFDGSFGSYQVWQPSYFFTITRTNPSATTTQTEYTTQNWLWENFINYSQKFGNHEISGLFGHSAFYEQYTELSATGTGLTFEGDAFGYLNGTQPGNQNTVASGFKSIQTLDSYFARASYAFRNKYLFDATIRADGSSMVSDGNKWGFFPSVAAGWVVSEEDFFTSSSTFSFMKLRASWGQNGSLSNLTPGQWRSAITFGYAYPDANGNLQVAAEPGVLNNPLLSWERSEQTDIGLDMGFFNNSFSLTLDYFNKMTKGLISRAVVPDFLGNNPPFDNIGTVANEGFEIEAGYNRQFGGLGFHLSANATFINNEVTALTRFDEEDVIPGAQVGTGWTGTASQIGQPLWYFQGYQTDGIFSSEEEVAAYTQNISGYEAAPGDPIVVDVNGDGQITADDQTFIGSPHPTAILGARLNLTFGGFDFTAFVQGTFGNDILMGFNRVDRASANKPLFFYEDRWTPENADADWFAPNTDSPYAYNSDLMIFDGSYIRIKQIQLGYTLPNVLTERMRMNSVRFYVSAENMFTFTDYPGIDPEVAAFDDNAIGIDRGTYAIPKRVLFGLSAKF